MPTRREANRFDGTLNGNQFRLSREEDSYVRTVQRSILPFNQSEEHDSKFNTRQDIRSLWQTSWADGALWFKPLISEASISSYNTARHMDVSTVPGDVYPRPEADPVSSGAFTLFPFGPALQVAADEVYYFEGSGAGNRGLIKYDGSAWSALTNDFGVAFTEFPVAMTWDADNASIFALFDNGQVAYVTPDSAGGTVIDIDTLYSAGSDHVYPGANIFMHFGRLLVWNGDKLIEVSDPLGTPSAAVIYDDGLGADHLTKVTYGALDSVIGYSVPRLAVPSPEGVWLIKNVNQEGSPTPFLTRVDRNRAGDDIGIPIGSIVADSFATDMIYHLGAVLISASPSLQRIYENDISSAGYPESIVYYYDNESFGTVGSVLGSDSQDEFVFKFLGGFGDKILIGGTKRVWVYDAIRGGLHPWMEPDSTPGGTAAVAFLSAVETTDSSGNEIYQYTYYGEYDQVIQQKTAAEGAGTAGSHYLESNYFDFNIPAEPKEVTHVTLMSDGIGASETWAVDIETDDGSWVEIATFTSADGNTTKKRFGTTQSGYRFRYRLRWTAAGATVTPPSRIKGIVFHAIQGLMVTQWQLVIDGKEFRNIENQPVNPEDVRTWFETVAGTDTVVSFVDEFRETSTTHNVKVDSARIVAQNPAEFMAIVTLTEDT